MNKKVFISIIINCYNGEEFLDETLSSVLNQSYLNWELIFWDNQSTDKSAEILKNYKHPNIRYFLALEHTSLGEARSLAIEKTKGDWIAFLDCDDFWDKDKLKYQVDAIKAYKGEVGLVYSNCQYFRDLTNKKGTRRLTRIVPGKKKLPQGQVSRYLFSGNFIPLPSILYKKSAVIKAGNLSKFVFCPDYFLNLSISLKYNVLAVDKTLCFYRLHNSNLSIGKKEIASLEAIYIIKLLVNDKKLDKFLRAFQVRYLIHLLENCEFRKIINLLKEIDLPNIFLGILDIINYRQKFNTKI